MVSQTVRVLYEDFKDIDTLRQSNMANQQIHHWCSTSSQLEISIEIRISQLAMFDYPRANPHDIPG